MLKLLLYINMVKGQVVPPADSLETFDLPELDEELQNWPKISTEAQKDGLVDEADDLLVYEYIEKMSGVEADAYNDFWYGEANIDDVEGLPVEYDESFEKGLTEVLKIITIDQDFFRRFDSRNWPLVNRLHRRRPAGGKKRGRIFGPVGR